MSGEIILQWGSNTEITWASSGFDSGIADGAATALSNTLSITGLSPGAIDVLLMMKSRTQTGTLIDPAIYLYAGSSFDNSNFTLNDIDTLSLVGVQFINTANTTEWSTAFSLARAFGGVLPPYVQFKIQNETNITLSSTANDNELYYIPVYAKQL